MQYLRQAGSATARGSRPESTSSTPRAAAVKVAAVARRLTPHLMGLSRRATAATFTAAARGVLDVLAGREPRAVADPAWRTHRCTQGDHS